MSVHYFALISFLYLHIKPFCEMSAMQTRMSIELCCQTSSLVLLTSFDGISILLNSCPLDIDVSKTKSIYLPVSLETTLAFDHLALIYAIKRRVTFLVLSAYWWNILSVRFCFKFSTLYCWKLNIGIFISTSLLSMILLHC